MDSVLLHELKSVQKYCIWFKFFFYRGKLNDFELAAPFNLVISYVSHMKITFTRYRNEYSHLPM